MGRLPHRLMKPLSRAIWPRSPIRDKVLRPNTIKIHPAWTRSDPMMYFNQRKLPEASMLKTKTHLRPIPIPTQSPIRNKQ
jgi:hypothetical protein